MWALSTEAVVYTVVLGSVYDLRAPAPFTTSRSLSGASSSCPHLQAGSSVCSLGRVMVTILNHGCVVVSVSLNLTCTYLFGLISFLQSDLVFCFVWVGWFLFSFLGVFFKFQNCYCKIGLLWATFHSCHLALSLIFDFSVNRLKTK